jgi:hypothetical protein
MGLAENAAVEVAPQFPWRITTVEALAGLRLRVSFADGPSGLVNISRLVHSPQDGVFAALADPTQFALVRLDYGAVTWPGNLDLAPYAMHQAIQEHGEWSL